MTATAVTTQNISIGPKILFECLRAALASSKVSSLVHAEHLQFFRLPFRGPSPPRPSPLRGCGGIKPLPMTGSTGPSPDRGRSARHGADSHPEPLRLMRSKVTFILRQQSPVPSAVIRAAGHSVTPPPGRTCRIGCWETQDGDLERSHCGLT